MPVRLATTNDLDRLASMGTRFLSRTRYSRFTTIDHDQARQAFATLIECGRVWVAEIDGVVHGFLAAILHPLWFSPGSRVALETAWWMDETHRGRPEGVRMLFEFEQWAREEGAKVCCMSDIVIEGDSAAERILGRLGYAVSERTFVKGL